jgi:hypothetical protein
MPALASRPCDGIWQHSVRTAEVMLMHHRLPIPKKGLPPQSHVYEHMVSGPWHIVFLEFEQNEPSAYFLMKDGGAVRFVTEWGGVASEDERSDVEKWALGVDRKFPGNLAECFAWYVTIGRYEGPPTRPNPFNRNVAR